jgi:hypothetical protein
LAIGSTVISHDIESVDRLVHSKDVGQGVRAQRRHIGSLRIDEVYN